MIKHSKYLINFIVLLMLLLVTEIFYLKSISLHVEDKKQVTKLVGLPDLTLANGANFVRHRSLSDTFSLFSNSPELIEYFPSTFTYNYAPIQHKSPSRIELEN